VAQAECVSVSGEAHRGSIGREKRLFSSSLCGGAPQSRLNICPGHGFSRFRCSSSVAIRIGTTIRSLGRPAAALTWMGAFERENTQLTRAPCHHHRILNDLFIALARSEFAEQIQLSEVGLKVDVPAPRQLIRGWRELPVGEIEAVVRMLG
jgi:hypothetical protein